MIIVLYRNEAGELYIAGEHDIDSQWLADLRVDCPNSCPKIVPRYVWEADEMQPEDFSNIGPLISASLTQYNFDGLVLEMGFSKAIISIVAVVRKNIQAKEIILVAHPHSCLFCN